jgi:hypothetical protein
MDLDTSYPLLEGVLWPKHNIENKYRDDWFAWGGGGDTLVSKSNHGPTDQPSMPAPTDTIEQQGDVRSPQRELAWIEIEIPMVEHNPL